MLETLRRLVLGIAALALAAPALAGDVNLNFYPASARWLDKDLWDPVESQYAFGGTVDFGESGWPIHIALGLHGSAGVEEFDNPPLDEITAAVSELSFGVAKVWETQGRTRPFLSGGLSFVTATYEIDTVFSGTADDDDDSIGAWIEGGVYWRLTAHFNLGLHGRFMGGSDISLFGVEGDADYSQFGPMIGWSWPPRK
ncbi:MAG TPA: hypothetical protein VFB95_11160 [Candidatus Cryosericum sp.]|nr:hypothetical protein [Candidatus Cryosericum sp.]